MTQRTIVVLVQRANGREVIGYEEEFPASQSPEMRLAELMVEAAMGEGNADMLPDSDACTCGVGDEDDVIEGSWKTRKLRPRIHHSNCAGSAAKSAALRPPPPVVEWPERYGEDLHDFPVLKNLLTKKAAGKESIDGVYDWADLKAAEANALALHHAGFQLPAVAEMLNRQEPAARQLIQNGAWKLERALRLMAPIDAAPHCDICAVAREMLVKGMHPTSRTA